MGIFKAYDIRGIYGTELTEDISANCTFTMNREGHRH